MIGFPNCKINLGLHIIGKRSDGYHNIETVFFPLHSFQEIVEIIQSNEFHLDISGNPIKITSENNLCVKAYDLLKKKFRLPHVRMHLHKTIPAGSGLGGGSADAAASLKILDEKFNLNLSQDEKLQLAAELGSDCAFFILNRPCFASGRGEKLDPIELKFLADYYLILVHPGFEIKTSWAFENIQITEPKLSIRDVITKPVELWKDLLKNDFENLVFKTYPEIAEVKNLLYKNGAIYGSLSGSGSAVYGLFRESPVIDFPFSYFVKTFQL